MDCSQKKMNNLSNLAFSTTSTVMLRNIALKYKSVTIFALTLLRKITGIEIF